MMAGYSRNHVGLKQGVLPKTDLRRSVFFLLIFMPVGKFIMRTIIFVSAGKARELRQQPQHGQEQQQQHRQLNSPGPGRSGSLNSYSWWRNQYWRYFNTGAMFADRMYGHCCSSNPKLRRYSFLRQTVRKSSHQHPPALVPL